MSHYYNEEVCVVCKETFGVGESFRGDYICWRCEKEKEEGVAWDLLKRELEEYFNE